MLGRYTIENRCVQFQTQEEIVALSEREQRLLEEMERGLYASEADSVPTTRATKSAPSYRAIVIGAILALAGIGLLVGGVATGFVWLGLLGFVAMLGGALYVFAPSNQVVEGQAEQPTVTRSETFAERAERRWGERMDGER